MAPRKAPARGHEGSSTPLADYFWIAGLDGQDLLDAYIKLGEGDPLKNGNANDLSGTIVEDEVAERDVSSTPESPRSPSTQSKRNSYQRLSRLSGDAQASIRSLDKVASPGTASARSSATIRAVLPTSPCTSAVLSDADFDRALKKFAIERDSFFLDVNFSAGALTHSARPKPRPRTLRAPNHDEHASGLTRSIGSVRKHMSFREMKSAKRQSVTARQSEFRAARLPVWAWTDGINADRTLDSFRKDIQTDQQLQLGDSRPRTPRSVAGHASAQEKVRTRPSRSISPERHAR